jgi:hypothetical protein
VGVAQAETKAESKIDRAQGRQTADPSDMQDLFILHSEIRSNRIKSISRGKWEIHFEQ